MRSVAHTISICAVIIAQLIGGIPLTAAQCTSGQCRLSAAAHARGRCCCSPNRSISSGNATCCNKNVNRCAAYEKKAGRLLCECGCNDSSGATPAQSKTNRSFELLARRMSRITTLDDTVAPPVRRFDAGLPGGTFYGGLSANLLFCTWLI